MRRSAIGLGVLALVATGGYAVWAGGMCSHHREASTQTTAGGGECGADRAAATCEAPGGKIAGHFDPAMSGVCRFACATKVEHKTADVLAQPGAKTGRLTRCPVSGVVFAVDPHRPRVRVAGDDYVTCCDQCATKLRRDPRRYLKV